MDRIGEHLNGLCIAMLKLVYMQLLWFLFTVGGLILFGIGPATYAMFTVMRQWMRGNTDLPIFKSFLHAFRTGFKESILIGLVYAAAGCVLYVDLLYVESAMLRGLLLVISFLYMISLCYIFPIMVHYDWRSVTLKLKCSILFGISYLQYTLVLFVALAAVYFVLLMYPGILLFFGVSVGSYMTMWTANQVFKRMEMQAGILEESNRRHSIEGGGEA